MTAKREHQTARDTTEGTLSATWGTWCHNGRHGWGAVFDVVRLGKSLTDRFLRRGPGGHQGIWDHRPRTAAVCGLAGPVRKDRYLVMSNPVRLFMFEQFIWSR